MNTDVSFIVELSIILSEWKIGTVSVNVIVGQLCEWRKVWHGSMIWDEMILKKGEKLNDLGVNAQHSIGMRRVFFFVLISI